MIIINDNKYELIKNHRDCFNETEIKEMVTEYFNDFDYIFGDYAYEKPRLKGFNDKTNKNFSSINDINTLDDYIKDYCSFNCKYFLLKKINK